MNHFECRKRRTQMLHQVRIHLDRDHAIRTLQQLRSQRSAAGTNLDDEFFAPRAHRTRDAIQDGIGMKKMLPELTRHVAVYVLILRMRGNQSCFSPQAGWPDIVAGMNFEYRITSFISGVSWLSGVPYTFQSCT